MPTLLLSATPVNTFVPPAVKKVYFTAKAAEDFNEAAKGFLQGLQN
jgi:hypothetical protein